jgi:hypothetical protein
MNDKPNPAFLNSAPNMTPPSRGEKNRFELIFAVLSQKVDSK